jgi:protein-S-isoprenylcysteine O-methyltransferase Ste14
VSVLRTIGWIFGVIYASVPPYWLVVHPYAERWRAHGAKLKHVGPIWIVIWIILGGASWTWRHVALYTSWWAWIPGAALILIAYGIYVMATKGFTHDQLVGRSEIEPDKHEQRLNISGIRARVRHPIYMGHLIHLTGWTVGTGLLVMYCFLPFAVITGALMIRFEERELVSRFGDAYRDYQRRVPAVIPRFSAHHLG